MDALGALVGVPPERTHVEDGDIERGQGLQGKAVEPAPARYVTGQQIQFGPVGGKAAVAQVADALEKGAEAQMTAETASCRLGHGLGDGGHAAVALGTSPVDPVRVVGEEKAHDDEGAPLSRRVEEGRGDLQGGEARVLAFSLFENGFRQSRHVDTCCRGLIEQRFVADDAGLPCGRRHGAGAVEREGARRGVDLGQSPSLSLQGRRRQLLHEVGGEAVDGETAVEKSLSVGQGGSVIGPEISLPDGGVAGVGHAVEAVRQVGVAVEDRVEVRADEGSRKTFVVLSDVGSPAEAEEEGVDLADAPQVDGGLLSLSRRHRGLGVDAAQKTEPLFLKADQVGERSRHAQGARLLVGYDEESHVAGKGRRTVGGLGQENGFDGDAAFHVGHASAEEPLAGAEIVVDLPRQDDFLEGLRVGPRVEGEPLQIGQRFGGDDVDVSHEEDRRFRGRFGPDEGPEGLSFQRIVLEIEKAQIAAGIGEIGFPGEAVAQKVHDGKFSFGVGRDAGNAAEIKKQFEDLFPSFHDRSSLFRIGCPARGAGAIGPGREGR